MQKSRRNSFFKWEPPRMDGDWHWIQAYELLEEVGYVE